MESSTLTCDYIFKFVIIGDTSVGKSCLMLQFINEKFRDLHEVTVGVEYGQKVIEYNGARIKLQIWDTAGAEIFHSVTATYYRGVSGTLLLYDISNKATYENTKKWLDELREHASPNVSVILVGNKSDLEDKREVPRNAAEDFATENGIMYIETSAKTGDNIENTFIKLVNMIQEKIKNGTIDPKIESNGVRVQKKNYDPLKTGEYRDTNSNNRSSFKLSMRKANEDNKKNCSC